MGLLFQKAALYTCTEQLLRGHIAVSYALGKLTQEQFEHTIADPWSEFTMLTVAQLGYDHRLAFVDHRNRTVTLETAP